MKTISTTTAIILFCIHLYAQVTFTEVYPTDIGIDSTIGITNVSFIDINNDCSLDIWAAGYFWLNDGTAHFTLAPASYVQTYMTCFGDYNNDGYADALNVTIHDIQLFKNEGPPNYQLVQVDSIAGLDSIYSTRNLWDGGWLDINNDGWIDFYIASYEKPLAVGHEDYIFLNNGDGTFSDISASAGIQGWHSCSRGLTFLDYNNDLLPDIYVSVYRLQQNLLWRNNGDNTFTNVAPTLGVQGTFNQGYYGHNIGTAAGDYNNDGYIDLFSPITHHAGYPGDPTNHLWENNGPSNFDFTDHFNSGTYQAEIGSAPTWVDYDLDGDLDLFYVNIYGAPGARCWLYRNDGGGTFTDVTNTSGLYYYNQERDFGLFGDLNNDGYPDAYIPRKDNNGWQRTFYISNGGTDNHWLNLTLHGSATPSHTDNTTTNASAIGARITAYTDSLMMTREVFYNNGNSYGSMFVPSQHFGLGNDSTLDSLIIQWPSGHIDRFYDLLADQTICIDEYTGIAGDEMTAGKENRLSVYPNPFSDILHVQFELSSNQKIIAEVFGITGQRLLQKEFNGIIGNNHMKINADHLMNGMYLLIISTDKGEMIQNVKLMKVEGS